MKAYITLFGPKPEVFQRVEIHFDYTPEFYLFDRPKYKVDYCTIESPILIKATALDEDVRVGIAEALGRHPLQIELLCEVECINLYKEPKVILEEIGV